MARPVVRSRIGGYVPVLIVLAVLVVTLLFNVFTYAALASHPLVGKAFRGAIKDDSPVIASYVLAGDLLRGVPGLEKIGDATANDAALPLAERMTGYPAGAGAVFFGETHSNAQTWMLRARTAMPFLLLLAAFMWWRRPRPVHLRERLRA